MVFTGVLEGAKAQGKGKGGLKKVLVSVRRKIELLQAKFGAITF